MESSWFLACKHDEKHTHGSRRMLALTVRSLLYRCISADAPMVIVGVDAGLLAAGDISAIVQNLRRSFG